MIYLNSISRLVFVIEKQCDFSLVGTAFLNIIIIIICEIALSEP
jgi:hypothetical protein